MQRGDKDMFLYKRYSQYTGSNQSKVTFPHCVLIDIGFIHRFPFLLKIVKTNMYSNSCH